MKKILCGLILFFVAFYLFNIYIKYEDKERIISQKTVTNYYGDNYKFIVTKKGNVYSVELENQGNLFAGQKYEYKKNNIIPDDIIEIYSSSNNVIHNIFLLTYEDRTQKIYIVSDDPYGDPNKENKNPEYDYNRSLLLDIQDISSFNQAYYPEECIISIQSFLESDNYKKLNNDGYPLEQLKKYCEENQN